MVEAISFDLIERVCHPWRSELGDKSHATIRYFFNVFKPHQLSAKYGNTSSNFILCNRFIHLLIRSP
jgi:hypothetical protein